MLPAEHRLTESALFAAAVRRGQRAGSRTLVMHLKQRESDDPALVGFVVSKSVGKAVMRNKVKRRLRALVAAHTAELPTGSLLVVRALPQSSTSDFDGLANDVNHALARLLERSAASCA